MMLLMRTNSSDGDFAGNCDLAIVDLDSEYCRRIIERLQFFREAQNHGDGDLREMAFDDDRLNCLSYEDYELSTDQDNALNSELIPIKVEEEDIDEGMFQSIECVYMIIDGAGVHWQCYPKHPDNPTITITTENMDYNFIESLIGKIEKEEDEEDEAETP